MTFREPAVLSGVGSRTNVDTAMRQTVIRSIFCGSGVLALAASAMASEEGSGGPSLFTGDLGNIFWSLLTFIAVLVVLGKFAWGPILGALQKREDFIRDSLKQAKEDREQAEARLKEYGEKLETARAEATAVVDEGRRDGEVLKRKIEEQAKAEATALVERAKREIQVATDTAVKELYSMTARLSTDIASRIIRKELSPADHERLVAESIEELSAVGDGRSAN